MSSDLFDIWMVCNGNLFDTQSLQNMPTTTSRQKNNLVVADGVPLGGDKNVCTRGLIENSGNCLGYFRQTDLCTK